MNPATLVKSKWLSWDFDRARLTNIISAITLPLLGLALFIGVWHLGAKQVDTSLGTFPGPTEVYAQWNNLLDEHEAENQRAAAFYERQEKRHEAQLERDPNAELTFREPNRRPTFFDQIWTSLITVMTGFSLATLIAIPLGIVIGLSNATYRAINPIIQIFKPVSPLAWLPLVTMVVSAVYVTDDPMFEKSFITSVVTVALCSIWPTMINTAVGTASVNTDLLNVSRVLSLNWFTHVKTIVLPSAIPMMFTGLRLSLGIAWMVLIAAEMLAQNPGLGKFVWDEFQNGSSNSLGRICVAVLMIGFIGFLLDRCLLLLQSRVNWDKNAITR
ncbi:ABC transporter permease [Marinimicrobium sp. C2-29]|uniref:ABC transporter permease n=1 Tax=Marinimicrobium sp. C2-29 TaxID=3139825 RepID=UPI00313A0C40